MRFIIFILIFFWTSMEGQLPYNHRLENEQIQAFGHLVFEMENSYLGIGRGIDSIDYQRGIFATEFDKVTGEILNTDKITFPNSLLFFNQLNSVLEINDNPHFLFNRRDTIYLTSFDDFEKELTIEKKIFSSVSTSSLFIYDFEKKGDDIYILAGHSTGEFNLVLYKYNSLEDSLTETFVYDELGYATVAKFLILENGNHLITYRLFINDNATQILKEITEEGEIVWKHIHDGLLENFSRSFISIGNGEFLVGGGKAKPNPTDPEGEGIPFLMKFNYDQKDIVKTSDFDIPQNEWFRWNQGVNEITPSHDSSSFFCVSKLYKVPINVDTLQSYGMIAKVDRDLNVIWRRNYARQVGEYADNELYDIIATSDGNYLAYGTSIKTYSNFPQEIPILSWAIKIDEDGKIVGDTTTSVIEWDTKKYKDEITIFPNPASSTLFINQDKIGQVTYKIIDQSGKLEDQFSINSKNSSISKNIDFWSSGLKIIYLFHDNKKIGSVKIIKH